ncbi:hypothetical protein ACFSX9_00345 [Flavobacterium ardleyense]|uniref:Lipoprotein n=1 Tax=Flavobacterium ardleyense TaxID=2038737 RepID=A0ABW5Z5P7_9FLAO
MKKLIIISFSLLIIFVLILFFLKRKEISRKIAAEDLTIYLYFDSYSRQFGYPDNKVSFQKFINYYEQVNKKKSKVWSYEYELISSEDSVKINLKSFYFYNNPSILKFAKLK